MTEPTTTGPLRSTASVATSTPERYAKQLASHLGRRAEIREETDGIRIVLTVGNCLVRPATDTLELIATASGPEELDVVTRVVGSHLERFGQRNELSVTWQRH